MTTSPEFDIRLVGPDHPGHDLIGNYAFGDTPRAPEGGEPKPDAYLAESRSIMAFMNNEAVAKVSTHAMTMNVRGRVMPMGGVGGVATMPAGRRGGRIRALMAKAYAYMRQDGQAVSALYPFRESFYQRLGYALLPSPWTLTVKPTDLAPLLRMPTTATVQQRQLADGFDDWIACLKAYQREHHGFALANAAQQGVTRAKGNRWLLLVSEGEEITGAMTYRIPGQGATMGVQTFHPRTLTARYALLEWIARHTDQAPDATLVLPPGEQPELWLPDLSPRLSSGDEVNWGSPMARIIDIAALSGVGAGDGDVTMAVTDDHCPWNTDTWRLRSSGGALEVLPAEDASAATAITIQGLASLLFNGIDPAMLRFRGWGDPDDATMDQLRRLFPPAQPFVSALF